MMCLTWTNCVGLREYYFISGPQLISPLHHHTELIRVWEIFCSFFYLEVRLSLLFIRCDPREPIRLLWKQKTHNGNSRMGLLLARNWTLYFFDLDFHDRIQFPAKRKVSSHINIWFLKKTSIWGTFFWIKKPTNQRNVGHSPTSTRKTALSITKSTESSM